MPSDRKQQGLLLDPGVHASPEPLAPHAQVLLSVVLPEVPMKGNAVQPSLQDCTCTATVCGAQGEGLVVSCQYSLPAERAKALCSALLADVQAEQVRLLFCVFFFAGATAVRGSAALLAVAAASCLLLLLLLLPAIILELAPFYLARTPTPCRCWCWGRCRQSSTLAPLTRPRRYWCWACTPRARMPPCPPCCPRCPRATSLGAYQLRCSPIARCGLQTGWALHGRQATQRAQLKS